MGFEDLDILSELCDDPLLTAEDAVEILETLDALSAQQARSESWAATLTITRTRACIRSCVAQLKQGMCVQQSVNDQPDADSTSTPTINHLVDPATHGSTTESKISQQHLQTLTTTPTSEQPPPSSLKKGMCVQQLVDAQSDANSTSTPSVDHLTDPVTHASATKFVATQVKYIYHCTHQ